MKKIIVSFFVAMGLISCSNAQKTSFSDEALSEKMLSQNGEEIALDEILKTFKGKPLIIEVWASWCEDCVAGMPKLKALQEQFPDLDYLFLSYDKNPESWAKGIEKYQLEGNHYLVQSKWKDGSFKKAIDLDWIPRYILVDKEGKIVIYRAIHADDENFIQTLKNLK